MKVVILCGGRGTRLGEETEFKPKPLVEIGGFPILWHIMKIYSYYGLKDFILCLGYKGEKIKEFFMNYDHMLNDFTINLKSKEVKIHNNAIEDWNVTCVDTGLETNTGGRIKRIEKYVNEDNFFLTYGDGVSNVNIKNLLEFHKSHGKIGTITAVKPVLRNAFGILEIQKDLHITGFTKANIEHQGKIDGGFFVFKKDFFDYLTHDCVLEDKPLKRLSENKQFKAYVHNDFWQCMDVPKQVELLNELWSSGKAPWKIW